MKNYDIKHSQNFATKNSNQTHINSVIPTLPFLNFGKFFDATHFALRHILRVSFQFS